MSYAVLQTAIDAVETKLVALGLTKAALKSPGQDKYKNKYSIGIGAGSSEYYSVNKINVLVEMHITAWVLKGGDVDAARDTAMGWIEKIIEGLCAISAPAGSYDIGMPVAWSEPIESDHGIEINLTCAVGFLSSVSIA